MSTTIAATSPNRPLEGESRIVLEGISWADYQELSRIVGDRPVRITYVDGMLEMMSPSYPHERDAELLGLLVRMVCLEFRQPCVGLGATTFKREGMHKGVEPDNGFYLAKTAQVRGRMRNPDQAPAPDLAIEVDLAHSSVDSLKAYASLGVPEVWHSDGRTLRFRQRVAGGTYEEVDRGPGLPMIGSAEVWEWVHRGETMDETEWLGQLQGWIRDVVVPCYAREPNER